MPRSPVIFSLLFVGCFNPVDGVYSLDTTAGWDGFCDTSTWDESDTGTSNIGVAASQGEMTLTDAAGSYPCTLDDHDFSCDIFADETRVAPGIRVGSTLGMDGAWSSSRSFEGEFVITLTCAEGDCAGAGYDDCTSILPITADFVE